MNRYKLRENVFKLLFMTQFHEKEEINKQIETYFESIEMQDVAKEDKEAVFCRYEEVAEKIEKIDELINEVAKGWKTDRMGKVDLSILRLAVYEMKYDEELPSGVAVNEAVELCKKYGQDESPAFVNGILAKLF